MNEELSNYLKDKGLTQKSIAEALGVSEQYVNALINGRSKFGKKQAEVWANKFGLSASWLLTGEGEMLRNVTNITHNVVHGNANNSIVGDNNNVSMLRPNKYGDSPNEERKWAPVIPQSYAHMPDFDIMGHITKQMTGGDIEKLYSGTANIDVWHYITDDALEPYYRRGDCLGLKAYEKDDLRIIPGELYAVDTRRDGLIVRILYNTESGDLLAKCTNKPAYDDFVIPRSDVIRIFKKVLRFSY